MTVFALPPDTRSSRTARAGLLALLPLLTLHSCRSAPPGQLLGDSFVPLTAFDVAAAQAMLSGNAVIRGVAVAKERDTGWLGLNLSTGHYARPGTLVSLFPCTRYFDEYLALRDYHGARAQISAEAFAVRREARVGADGAFEFTDLGPGRYYIEAIIRYTQATTRDVQTGVEQRTIQGSNQHFSWQHVDEIPIYATIHGSYEASVLAKGFVSIDPGDDEVSIKIRN